MAHSRPRSIRRPSSASLSRALIVGLVASIANSLAIRATAAFTRIPTGTGGLSKMVLTQAAAVFGRLGLTFPLPIALGPVGQEVFHTGMGLSMAVVYAFLFEPAVPGPRWVRGLLFCQIAWLIQAFVVLPYVGAGLLGRGLSPATPWVSWGLNAVYGLILGLLYRPREFKQTEHLEMR